MPTPARIAKPFSTHGANRSWANMEKPPHPNIIRMPVIKSCFPTLAPQLP